MSGLDSRPILSLDRVMIWLYPTPFLFYLFPWLFLNRTLAFITTLIAAFYKVIVQKLTTTLSGILNLQIYTNATGPRAITFYIDS